MQVYKLRGVGRPLLIRVPLPQNGLVMERKVLSITGGREARGRRPRRWWGRPEFAAGRGLAAGRRGLLGGRGGLAWNLSRANLTQS